jgi:isoquinoline 1-oxidoreductase beta subunit
VFTQDVKLDGMLTALVAHPPRFGAGVSKVDSSQARSVAGVSAIHEIPTGVAVVATDFWSASKARDALRIDWDESTAIEVSSGQLMTRYRELAETPGRVARHEGSGAEALDGAAQRLEASFEFPYLAHASMEPMNCVIRLDDDSCEVWNGEQLHTGDQMALGKMLGIAPEKVRINTLFAGGSFGRRANPNSDYLLEAASIAKAIGKKAPVKLIWTREDDMRAGWFRPMYFHKLHAGLDAGGKPIAWQHRIVGQSIAAGTAFESGLVTDGIDSTSVEGASNLPYAIPNIAVELHTTDVGIPVQWWRSVGSTHTAFAVECFIDELAHAAGRDPVEYRLELLKDHPRHSAVLQLAAERAGWGKPLPDGRARGVALHESFNTRVAQVAELARQADGKFSVERVVIAVDCGIAINPDVIKAQMEGGMGYGLSATLESAITIDNGSVVEGNFDGYRVLRMHQMPEVEVHIVRSAEAPTGVGEPATPVIAPAVANALFALVGKRARRLPLGEEA